MVGSGAAGLASAVRAASLKLEVLVVEATDRYGGSTAISGGVVWIPCNDQMIARGVPDSPEEALTYLRGLTRGEIPEARLQAYVGNAARALRWLEENTWFKLDSLESYADYYPEAPGGKPGGRSMEPVPFDATQLGDEFRRLRKPHPQSQVMGRFGITAREARGFLVPGWSGRFGVLRRMIQYVFRWFKRRNYDRDTKLHAGNALIARLRKTLLEQGVPLWLSTPVTGLIRDGDTVVGAVVEREGKPVRVRARRGVLLGAGGFERNQAWREQHGPTPISTDWNAGNEANVGQGIQLGIDAGAAVERMGDAWWTPVTRVPRSDKAWVLVVEKNLPGGIFVNRQAKRFTNEAAPYLDVALAMYGGDAVPVCWLVFDARFRRSYPVGPLAPGWAMPDARIGRKFREEFLRIAPTLDALAEKLGLDAAALKATVDRWNAQCETGIDPDFGRGTSLADRYYGDPTFTKNPNLGPIVEAPFYAIPVFPGDLGTKGGLVTDPSARVLRADGTPIPGLYAAGNTSAAVMGPTYPGAGGTIGPALVFGLLAAEAAAADSVD